MEKINIKELMKLDNDELVKVLNKFPPERRVKILKELDEARKERQEESDKLLKQAIEEVSIEDTLANVEVPKDDSFDLDRLFEQESLEDQVKDAPKIDVENTDYNKNMDYITKLYDEFKELTSSNPSYDNMQRAGEIYDKIMQEHYTGLGEAVKGIADSSRKLMKDLQGDYMTMANPYRADK